MSGGGKAMSLLIKGMLTEFPKSGQDAVLDAADKLRAVIAEGDGVFPGAGTMALALIGAEKQAEAEAEEHA